MLIRTADIVIGARGERGIRDVRIRGNVIAEIGTTLCPDGDETVIDAGGGALLPGLNDHHIHLVALAAALDSLRCGPPDVRTSPELATALEAADADASNAWVRGVGYHESVAGEIDRHWLDLHIRRRPARIQHRSGRLWILNSLALQTLGVVDDGAGNDPFERADGRLTGRLYDADDWLRRRLGSQRPGLARVSRLLASRGITGVTDTSHRNGPDDFAYFVDAQQRGELLQELVVMGDAGLDAVSSGPRIHRGATKFHLHDNALPDFEALCDEIRRSHGAGRPVAFHCVTRVDLAFALAALEEADSRKGDRIEHASIAPPEALETMKSLGVIVVTQPNFVSERGDSYRSSVDADDRPWLYRLRAFIDAGIALAAGTDAPYGQPDPWAAMAAAVSRRTASGATLGAHEGLSPEAALALFASPLRDPGRSAAPLRPGTRADCCLLERPWRSVRQQLTQAQVRLTLADGDAIWQA